jgi:hypothetical protein
MKALAEIRGLLGANDSLSPDAVLSRHRPRGYGYFGQCFYLGDFSFGVPECSEISLHPLASYKT